MTRVTCDFLSECRHPGFPFVKVHVCRLPAFGLFLAYDPLPLLLFCR